MSRTTLIRTATRGMRRPPVLRARRLPARTGASAAAWRLRRQQPPLQKYAAIASLAIHGALLAVLGNVVVVRRPATNGDRPVVVAVDVGRWVSSPPREPPPPPLPELPPRSISAPEPLPIPELPAIEIAAVEWPRSSAEPAPDLDRALEELLAALEPPPAEQPPSVPPESPRWQAVREAIMRALRYPEASRIRGEEGRVWIVLRLREDGSIESLEGAGDIPRLVAAALAAVRRAAPFPGSGPATYRIPVSFRLVESRSANARPPLPLL
ncbi:MAG: TonB family protein [Kiritimatiellae bacterium]|nr:TonB family protein [Kiritimatiellia bacterium]